MFSDHQFQVLGLWFRVAISGRWAGVRQVVVGGWRVVRRCSWVSETIPSTPYPCLVLVVPSMKGWRTQLESQTVRQTNRLNCFQSDCFHSLGLGGSVSNGGVRSVFLIARVRV